MVWLAIIAPSVVVGKAVCLWLIEAGEMEPGSREEVVGALDGQGAPFVLKCEFH